MTKKKIIAERILQMIDIFLKICRICNPEKIQNIMRKNIRKLIFTRGR